MKRTTRVNLTEGLNLFPFFLWDSISVRCRQGAYYTVPVTPPKGLLISPNDHLIFRTKDNMVHCKLY